MAMAVRCARAAIQKRELADYVACLVFRENHLLPFRAFDEKLNTSGAQDKDLAAGIAVMKNCFTFFEVAAVHHLGQRFALFIVK